MAERIIKGNVPVNNTAFTEMVKAQGGWLKGLATKKLNGNVTAAEDLTQEVLLGAFRSATQGRFDPTWDRGCVSMWLSRAAQNGVIDMARRKSARPQEVYGADVTSLAHTSSVAESVTTKIQIENALAELSSNYRKIVTMVDMYGFTMQETADTLNIPLGTVKSSLHFARAKLREALGDLRESA